MKTTKELNTARMLRDIERDPAKMTDQQRELWIETQRELQPLIMSLRKAGLQIKDFYDLAFNVFVDRDLYRMALPIVVDFYPRLTSDKVKWGLIDFLRNRWAKPFATPLLLSEFERSPGTDPPLGWYVADALTYTATKENLQSIISLFQRKEFGIDRQQLASVLAKIGRGDDRVVQVLISALDDADVRAHAIEALGKLKAMKAAPHIRSLLDHEHPLVRSEAKKALRRIEGS